MQTKQSTINTSPEHLKKIMRFCWIISLIILTVRVFAGDPASIYSFAPTIVSFLSPDLCCALGTVQSSHRSAPEGLEMAGAPQSPSAPETRRKRSSATESEMRQQDKVWFDWVRKDWVYLLQWLIGEDILSPSSSALRSNFYLPPFEGNQQTGQVYNYLWSTWGSSARS